MAERDPNHFEHQQDDIVQVGSPVDEHPQAEEYIEAELQTPDEIPPTDEVLPSEPGDPVAEAAPAADAAAPGPDVAPVDDGMGWYIIHTYSGFERKVAESLKSRAEAFGFATQLGQLLAPAGDRLRHLALG